MKKNIGALLVSLALTLGAGALSALLAGGEQAMIYASLQKPPLAPPGRVFGIVWTILYVLMAVAAWLVWRAPASPARTSALRLYGAQLFFNFIWSILFFRFGLYGWAFTWLGLLLVLIALTTVQFFHVNRAAGLLLLPYLLWVLFAGYLNFMIALYH